MSVATARRVVRGARLRARRAIETPATEMWRRSIIAAGTDVTTASAGRSCLVLAPHPDDETLGCGATIARKRAAGTAVRVVVATDGRFSHRSAAISPTQLASIRAAEVAEACECLGVRRDDLVLLRYEEATLTDRLDALTGAIVEQLEDVRPDEVLVTSGRDWHVDHRVLQSATAAAIDRSGSPAAVAEYPVWLWADGPWRAADRRRGIAGSVRPVLEARALAAQLVSTDGYLTVKRRAVRAYQSQTTNLTGEPSWAVMDDRFLALFLREVEVFLRVPPLRAGAMR